MSGWGDDLAGWWIGEVESDPAYRIEVLPLALEMLGPQLGGRYLDMGCGTGALMREIKGAGAEAVGVDSSVPLARIASDAGPVVLGALPDTGFLSDESFDGVALVLVLEHVDDSAALFAEAHRVTRPGGTLAIVANHPLMTAPGSSPVFDPDDGEVLWRIGEHLTVGRSDERAGDHRVTFHHRPLSVLLTQAAAAGWHLEAAEERSVGGGGDPLLAAQRQVPRLLGLRWTRPVGGGGAH